MKTATRLRPLLARPGARFRCFGLGTCCTDLHRLGALERRDLVLLRKHGAHGAVIEQAGGEHDLRFTPDGRCTLLVGTRCSLHAAWGASAKPAMCRGFPYGLVATPLGGRITTAHRCPCRTLGDRPPLSLADAETSLSMPGGKLARLRDAPARVSLTSRTSVSFAGWTAFEAPLLARLAAGEPPDDVLAAPPVLPSLRDRQWRDVAAEFHAYGVQPTRGHQAVAWFGDGILLALGDRPEARPRPWREDFDEAEARVTTPEPAAKVIGDWLAELVWDMSWAAHGPFDRARASISALGVMARALTDRLIALGARPDRAAAEALLIAEIGAQYPIWADAVMRMAPASRRADTPRATVDNEGR